MDGIQILDLSDMVNTVLFSLIHIRKEKPYWNYENYQILGILQPAQKIEYQHGIWMCSFQTPDRCTLMKDTVRFTQSFSPTWDSCHRQAMLYPIQNEFLDPGSLVSFSASYKFLKWIMDQTTSTEVLILCLNIMPQWFLIHEFPNDKLTFPAVLSALSVVDNKDCWTLLMS